MIVRMDKPWVVIDKGTAVRLECLVNDQERQVRQDEHSGLIEVNYYAGGSGLQR